MKNPFFLRIYRGQHSGKRLSTRCQAPERTEENRKAAIKGGCILFAQLFNEIINIR